MVYRLPFKCAYTAWQITIISCCDEQVTSHQVFVAGLIEGDIVKYEEEVAQPDDDTMKNFHPVKWLKKKKGDLWQSASEDDGKVQISVLYLCTMIKESNQTRAHTILQEKQQQRRATMCCINQSVYCWSYEYTKQQSYCR